MVYGMNPEPGRISTILVSYRYKQADMAELVYAHDSKSCGETHVGSSPTVGTIQFEVLENFLNWMQN